MLTLDDLLVAIGLVMIIEGVLWGAFARHLRDFIMTIPVEATRPVGLIFAVAGFILIWFIRS